MVSCLGPRKDDSMVFICVNWSMTCRSTVECCKTTLGLVPEGCIVVSDNTLSVLVEPVEMSCAEAADVLAPWAGDLKAEDLRSPMHLMCLQEAKFILNPVLPLSFPWAPGQTWMV